MASLWQQDFSHSGTVYHCIYQHGVLTHVLLQLLHTATFLWLAVSEEGITVLSDDQLVGHHCYMSSKQKV